MAPQIRPSGLGMVQPPFLSYSHGLGVVTIWTYDFHISFGLKTILKPKLVFKTISATSLEISLWKKNYPKPLQRYIQVLQKPNKAILIFEVEEVASHR